MISCNVCLSLYALLHLVWSSLGPITLLQMALFHSCYYWIIFHYIDMYMYHTFIHSYVNEHICCFHVLAIINRATVSIEVQVSFWTMFFSRFMHVLCLVAQLCPTLCDPMDCSPPGSSVHGDSPGKSTGMGCHALLQGIFPTQESNPGLQHCRWILYHLSYQWSSQI